MTKKMNAILERVLSQEIAHQEIWEKEDIARFGESMSRADTIAEIKQFMQENDIRFNHEFYIQEF